MSQGIPPAEKNSLMVSALASQKGNYLVFDIKTNKILVNGNLLFYLKIKIQGWRCSSVEECMLCMCTALG
jgi:hypothetical protein